MIIVIVLIFLFLLCVFYYRYGLQKLTYSKSTPDKDYAEIDFNNWLDWFTITPEKWCFIYINDRSFHAKYEIKIPCYIEFIKPDFPFFDGQKKTFIKFTYDDFKRFQKWYKQYEREQELKDNIEYKNKMRHENEVNTLNLLKNVQKDINNYKAKIDKEMDNAVSMCREVTTNIVNRGV